MKKLAVALMFWASVVGLAACIVCHFLFLDQNMYYGWRVPLEAWAWAIGFFVGTSVAYFPGLRDSPTGSLLILSGVGVLLSPYLEDTNLAATMVQGIQGPLGLALVIIGCSAHVKTAIKQKYTKKGSVGNDINGDLK